MYYFGEILSFLNEKRDTSEEKLISEYSHTPNIDFMIIMLLPYGFRREVDRSTTECASEQRWADGPPKITNLNDPFLIEYIFRLEIPVDNLMKMEVVEGSTELLSDYPDRLLTERVPAV